MLTDPKVNVSFNLLFFKRIALLLSLMLPTVLRQYKDWVFTLIMLVLGVTEQVAIYFVGLIPSKFYLVIPLLRWDKFARLLGYSFGLIVAITIIVSLKEYVSRVLYIIWRKNLCKAMNEKYFKNLNFYRLNLESTNLDNMDQRMTQDIDLLSNSLTKVLTAVFILPFTAVYYSYTIFENLKYYGFLGPCVYFAVFTIVNKFLISYVSPYIYEQERLEGIYRYNHVRVRRECDGLALTQGKDFERDLVDSWLGRLVAVIYQRVNRELLLRLWENFAGYLGSVLSYLIVGVAILSGEFPDARFLSTVISEYSFKIMYLIFVFTQLIQQNANVTVLVGAATRVAVVLEQIRCYGDVPPHPAAHYPDDEAFICFDNLSCGLPGGARVFVKDMTLTIEREQFVVISGPSGCGKTSLFRTVMNIWKPLNGRIVLKNGITMDDLMCLPQTPYCTYGSLIQQISFPENPEFVDISLITSLLDEFGLSHLIEREKSVMGEGQTWYETLSPGEKQRLSFIRLFYHKPKVVLFDESFTHIEDLFAERVYNMCRRHKMTVMEITHRRDFLTRYDMYIMLSGGGVWELTVPFNH